MAKIPFGDDLDDDDDVNVEDSCTSGLMPDPTGPPFGIVLNGHALVSRPPDQSFELFLSQLLVCSLCLSLSCSSCSLCLNKKVCMGSLLL